MINRGDPAFVMEFVHADAATLEDWDRLERQTSVFVGTEGIIAVSSAFHRAFPAFVCKPVNMWDFAAKKVWFHPNSCKGDPK